MAEIQNVENHFKLCRKCNTMKAFEEYYHDQRRKRHINPNCKECVKDAQRRAYVRNREQALIRGAIYRNKIKEMKNKNE